MYIQEKTSSGTNLIPLETQLLSERKIFIEGRIDAAAACSFARQTMYLNSQSRTLPIDVYINSEGGEIVSGMAIYDTIQSSPAPIRMFCIGSAYSMGAILFACGNYGRYMMPHSELMLHEPLLSSQISGNASSIRSISESLCDTRKKMNRLLAKHTGRTEQEVESATSYDHFMSAEECVNFGLCDEIKTFSQMIGG